ncbi:MAG TPA: helix-turn-helix domain-containing protein [Gammaproteobacteria bacterium]|nr:helix-turn-helix domain-containing protein [Gammaproteobacteria bacterium]
MIEFYRKAILIFFGLLCLTMVLAIACLNGIFVHDALQPASDSAVLWRLGTATDTGKGGTSSVTVNDAESILDYDYVLTKRVEYPYVIATLYFLGLENAALGADLSAYSTATFRVKCTPHNVLSFYLHSFDQTATEPGNFSSYRLTETLFACHEGWSNIEIDLKHLTVPAWWLEKFKLEASDQTYRLDKVGGLSIGASQQGPVDISANVKIEKLALRGRDWRYAWAFAGWFVLAWLGFMYWLFRQYTKSLVADVKDKLQKDRPLIAHQQLSTEPQRDQEKTALLRFIATEYADPDLSLEKTTTTLGINRIKINGILKEELGLTFTAYLNKLRLTEAARLLSENDKANVAEIAFSVGYNNVTYFNKLFRDEYGCSPTKFKEICKRSTSYPDTDF